jgi:hypothetical protein
MLWILGSAALLLSIVLAFRFADSRPRLYATLAVIFILAASASALVLMESHQSTERKSESATRIKPEDVAISDAALTHEYGRWYLRGRITNNSEFPVASLTTHVTVQECAPEPCRTTGEAESTNYGMTVAPGVTSNFEMLMYLPDTPVPVQMKWDYRVLAVGAAR